MESSYGPGPILLHHYWFVEGIVIVGEIVNNLLCHPFSNVQILIPPKVAVDVQEVTELQLKINLFLQIWASSDCVRSQLCVKISCTL